MTPDQRSRGWLVAAEITVIGTVLSLLILIDNPSLQTASMFVLGCGLVALWLSFAWRARRDVEGSHAAERA